MPNRDQCDLRVPRCSTCERQDEQCNITDCVTYPYAAIESLKSHIRDLETKLEAANRQPSSNDHRPQAVSNEFQPPRGPSSPRIEQPATDEFGSSWAGDIVNEAQELGTLVVGGPDGHSNNIYGESTSPGRTRAPPRRPRLEDHFRTQAVGSATGSTFARIFFKQLNLSLSPATKDKPQELSYGATQQNAALPPQPIARFLLSQYFCRVHLWWPFLSLPALRRAFLTIYDDPRRCSDYNKFVVFAVLALGSAQSSESREYARLMELNDPGLYFRTSLRLFSNLHDHPRDIRGVNSVLLLFLWMMGLSSSSHSNDLWQLSRYAMSMALEAGMHRRTDSWGFSSEELETRNRVWWCVYCLERQVAVSTGRVLSVREAAMDAPIPKSAPWSLDKLNDSETTSSPVLAKLGVLLFNHMIQLRRIGGRILESVYIARGPDGKAASTTFQQIYDEFHTLQTELDLWKKDMDALNIKGTRECSEMRVEYGLLLLLMHRPSPTFMIPSRQMVAICSLQSGFQQCAPVDKTGIPVWNVCRHSFLSTISRGPPGRPCWALL